MDFNVADSVRPDIKVLVTKICYTVFNYSIQFNMAYCSCHGNNKAFAGLKETTVSDEACTIVNVTHTQMYDIRANTVQEALVMRNNQKSLLP